MKQLLVLASSVILVVLFWNDVGDDDLDTADSLATDVSEFVFSVAVLSQGVVLIRMKDKSMHPLIRKNDVVIVNPDEGFKEGKVYVVSVFHKRRRIRKVKTMKDGFILTPVNSDFAVEKVPQKNIRRLLRVVGAMTGNVRRKIT